MASAPRQSSPVRGFISDTLLSTLVPLAVYEASRRWLHSTELIALIFAGLYPMLKSLADLARHRQINPVSVRALRYFTSAAVS